jgi:hypothetical protein
MQVFSLECFFLYLFLSTINVLNPYLFLYLNFLKILYKAICTCIVFIGLSEIECSRLLHQIGAKDMHLSITTINES